MSAHPHAYHDDQLSDAAQSVIDSISEFFTLLDQAKQDEVDFDALPKFQKTAFKMVLAAGMISHDVAALMLSK